MVIFWTWGTAAGAAGLASWALAVPTKRRAATSAAVFEPNRDLGCMVSRFPVLYSVVKQKTAGLVVRGRCHLQPRLHPPTSKRRNTRAMRVNFSQKASLP